MSRWVGAGGISAAVSVVLFCSTFAIPAPADTTPPPPGLSGLDENALYTELADRGLDDLLQRVMEQDHVPPEQRKAISSIASMHRLETEKGLSEDQRAALLDKAVAGIDQILLTLHDDPQLTLQQAKTIAQYGVDPLTGLLEYWGDSDIERNRLRPLADAAFKMYDQADKVASAQADAIANKITSPDDKLADQWRQVTQISAAAAYQKARMQYALALSLDPSDPQRQGTITDALKAFGQWDNSDSQIQTPVRLLMTKLHVLTGDKDEIAEAVKLLDSIIDNPQGQISPAPSPEMIFEAKCYKVIADIVGGNLSAAQQALASATSYQQSNFPGDRDQTAALRLLNYRLMAASADARAAGPDKDFANASAVAALTQLVHDFPNLRDAIYRQLAARLPNNPQLATLDPMLLMAMVDQGRQAIVGAGAGQKVDPAKLKQASDAAREILSRAAGGQFPRAQAAEASLLLGIFQEYSGDKMGAVDSLLDHIEHFGSQPNAHSDVALERARSLIAELLQTSGSDPRVKQLENRFLPIAVNPPFERREFVQQYADLLFSESKWALALKYYRRVPDSEPPIRRLVARYSEMLCLKGELEETANLSGDQKQDLTAQIQSLAQSVSSLAGGIISGDSPPADKARAKSTLAKMTLIAADILRQQSSDPQKILDLLNGFEESTAGLPDAQSLTSGALFLRVQAYMQLSRNDDATSTLVKYLNTAGANEGAQTVHDLLTTLNTELDRARAAGNTEQIRQLASDRAMLSGFLVKWASGSSDPKIHGYAYIYRRFDADTKRLAAEVESDPAARQRDLSAALDLYKQLQSPENVALYQAGLEAGADKDYPDPAVTLGIGLIAYEQGDCKTVRDTLGRLIQDEKLGDNTDQYWEAAFKLMDCMNKLAAQGDPQTTPAQVQQAMKVLYLLWHEQTGGPKYHEKFEALRKQVLPDWTPPKSQSAG